MGHAQQAENKKGNQKQRWIIAFKTLGTQVTHRVGTAYRRTSLSETWARWSHFGFTPYSTQGKLSVSWTCFACLSTPTTPLHTYPSTILYGSAFPPTNCGIPLFLRKSQGWGQQNLSWMWPSFEGLSPQIQLKIGGSVALVKATWSLIQSIKMFLICRILKWALVSSCVCFVCVRACICVCTFFFYFVEDCNLFSQSSHFISSTWIHFTAGPLPLLCLGDPWICYLFYQSGFYHSWLNVKSCILPMAQNGPCPLHSYKVVSFPLWGLWNLTVWFGKTGTAEEVAFQPWKQSALRALGEDATPDPSAHCREVPETALLLRSSSIRHIAASLHPKDICPVSLEGQSKPLTYANYAFKSMVPWGLQWLLNTRLLEAVAAISAVSCKRTWFHTCWGAWDQLGTTHFVLTSLEIYSCVCLFLNWTAVQTRVSDRQQGEGAC